VAGVTELLVDAVRREDVDPTTGAVGAANSERKRTVVVRAAGEHTARIRATFDSVDNLGHVLQQTAHGQVALTSIRPGDPPAAVDPVIVSHTEPDLMGDG